MITRRGVLGGLLATLAAPAIIRTPGLLMPVRAIPEWQFSGFSVVSNISMTPGQLAAELREVTRRAFIPRLYVQIYAAENPLLAAFESAAA